MEQNKPFIPAFDPDHPDEEILAAFANICALKVEAYKVEDRTGEAISQEHADEMTAGVVEQERFVVGNFAQTASGVAARLALLLENVDPDVEVDRAVVEGKFRGLYEARENLSFTGQQLSQAIYELFHVEWDQALADYERATAASRATGQIVDAVDRFKAEVGIDSPAVQALAKLAAEQYLAATALFATRKLIRTITPHPEDLQRKLEIIMKEQWDEDVAPWIARDAKFLMGRMPIPKPPAAAPALKQAA